MIIINDVSLFDDISCVCNYCTWIHGYMDTVRGYMDTWMTVLQTEQIIVRCKVN